MKKKTLLVLLTFSVAILAMTKCIEYKQTENLTTSQVNTDGNTKILSRSARNSDVIVVSDLDLSSFGAKYTITPQTDINQLVITITFLDSNKNALISIQKPLGNVKEGVQVNFSVSLFDLGLSVIWNIEYESWTITGGTVSYFA